MEKAIKTAEPRQPDRAVAAAPLAVAVATGSSLAVAATPVREMQPSILCD